MNSSQKTCFYHPNEKAINHCNSCDVNICRKDQKFKREITGNKNAPYIVGTKRGSRTSPGTYYIQDVPHCIFCYRRIMMKGFTKLRLLIGHILFSPIWLIGFYIFYLALKTDPQSVVPGFFIFLFTLIPIFIMNINFLRRRREKSRVNKEIRELIYSLSDENTIQEILNRLPYKLSTKIIQELNTKN